MRTLLLMLPLLLGLVLPCSAGGKRDQKSNIVFHMETNPGENPKMAFTQFVGGEKRTFSRVPDISTRDIAAFNPFPSQDGAGYGVLIRLKPGSKTRLTAITAANQGRWMLARVNGRVVDGVMIDRQIDDGELVIWKGLSSAEIKMLDEEFPRISQKKKP
ncbi:hypothetical protein HNR46_000137 [Haloferula luteola]|uniref:Uncharacterized protein n=1 Tax=Haloferula luteola TaxID=595692 RepID=A0A840UYL4_9BACT|nr:hypothetical protein [Haloferula luteola]MBB5349916.1 hypothetical protein [Haloferula luteola]